MEHYEWKLITPEVIQSWKVDDDYADPDDPDDYELEIPPGIVLLDKTGKQKLVGNERAGYRTKGCTCCSDAWKNAITDYTHYVQLSYEIKALQ